MLQEIKFDQRCCAEPGEMRENVLATLKRGYESITPYLNSVYAAPCSIVGAGPSIADTYEQLRGHVMAINSAHGFLIDRGVTPHLCMLWDCSPLVAEFAVPHPETIFLVAARCHPYVFERLAGCRIVVWFADGDHDIREILRERGINEPLIKGGSAGVTRAQFLAYALGYRDLHVFGADASYSDSGKTHINGSVVREKDMRVWLTPERIGAGWRTTPEWCLQANEHTHIVPMFRRLGAKISVHGDGMLPTIHRSMAA